MRRQIVSDKAGEAGRGQILEGPVGPISFQDFNAGAVRGWSQGMMQLDPCPRQIPLTVERSVKTALEPHGPSFFSLGPPEPPAAPELISSARALLVNGTHRSEGAWRLSGWEISGLGLGGWGEAGWERLAGAWVQAMYSGRRMAWAKPRK